MYLSKIYCNRISLIGLLCLLSIAEFSAQNTAWSSARIKLEIDKLSSTGSVLYIAAHPDDENTRLITWLANEQKVRTGYLSLTRGDGGQNLVGEEQGAYLGVIRTQELLAARRMDGGEQFFTRAVDFGYSKTAAETFTKWDRDSILSDVVWVIRNFKPDVIITRFPADERAGHGHHTASAMLAEEAFAAAADPTKFPEQLAYVSTWQAERLFWNNSTWWDKQLPEKIANGDPNLCVFDTGGFNVLLGKSYGEIAAESRTNHKSQGFGSTPVRGEQKEYVEWKKGTPFTGQNIFSDIPMTWSRFPGGESIDALVKDIAGTFDYAHPENSIDKLLELRAQLKSLPAAPIITQRITQTEQIIAACLGLYLEPAALSESVAAGESLTLVSTAIRRAPYPVTLEQIEIGGVTFKAGEILPVNINQLDTLTYQVPAHITSNPYWLEGDYAYLFDVPERSRIGKAENDPAISVKYYLRIGNTGIVYTRGVVYKETDAVKGEIIQPLTVSPQAYVHPQEDLLLFTRSNEKEVTVSIQSNTGQLNGYLFGIASNGFTVSGGHTITGLSAGKSQTVSFVVNSTHAQDIGALKVYFIPGDGKRIVDSIRNAGGVYQAIESYVETSGKGLYRFAQTIAYDHIPTQHILEHAEVRLVKVQTSVPDIQVAYVEGAGDKVDESLRALGLQVTTLKAEDITAELLKQYQAVVVGVRAYNTEKALIEKQALLMQYVSDGGTVIVQYSTSWDAYIQQLGPYPFKVTRTRVTDEQSPVAFNLPEHPVLQKPNAITEADFQHWVQERGIYFAGEVAPEYQMPLSFQDPGEQMQSGAVIVCSYGKGTYVYTGLAFFRELPAGVPGAYRLFVNMLSLSSHPK